MLLQLRLVVLHRDLVVGEDLNEAIPGDDVRLGVAAFDKELNYLEKPAAALVASANGPNQFFK